MQLARVTNRTQDTLIGERIEVAATSFTRMWGLLGRTGLTAGGGLWIKPSSGVHTVGMKFAIDVLGLDNRLRVVAVWTNLVPFRLTRIVYKVSSVIEIPAGRAHECAVNLGDELQAHTYNM